MNVTMSMVMNNITNMVHGMDHGMHNMSMTNATSAMDHGMHDMSMTNATAAMDHGMHGHMGHGVVTDPTMHHHGGGMTDGGMVHNHDGMTQGGGMVHNHGGMTHGTGHGDHSSHGAVGHDMLMFFNFQLPIHVLFFGWEVSTQGQLAGACIAWCILAIVYEGLKSFREYILSRMMGSEKKYLVKSNRNGNADDANVTSGNPGCLAKMFNGWHVLLSILQIVQTTLGMFLMLVYMTFNVWLAFSISLGSGLGYWMFAWNKRSVEQFNDGHCV